MPTLTIKSDKPMILIPVEEYESMLETLEILSDQHLMRSIEQGQKDDREGKTVKLSKLSARSKNSRIE
jgi:PHD/YefM family antitoxin component YafN of YafNO toxin-antitoxin module